MRARNIKPGFYKNEDLAECSIWARLLFPGLWMLADREGRLEDRPKRIKAELFAFDNVEVSPLLDELQARGFLVRYRNEDGNFIQIAQFNKHQTPHYSEKSSAIKPPQLQEKALDEEPQRQEGSKKERGIKGGSQPPDSLNPDSLNPEIPPNPRKRGTPSSVQRPAEIPEQVWADWLRARKSPLTETAWEGVKREAGKAGISLADAVRISAECGWRGFKADWLKPKTPATPQRPNFIGRLKEHMAQARQGEIVDV